MKSIQKITKSLRISKKRRLAKNGLEGRKQAGTISRRRKSMDRWKDGLQLGGHGLWNYRYVTAGQVFTGCTGEAERSKAALFLLEKRGNSIKELREGVSELKSITLIQGFNIWSDSRREYVTSRYLQYNRRILELHFKNLLQTKLDVLNKQQIERAISKYLEKTQSGKEIKTYSGSNKIITLLAIIKKYLSDAGYRVSYKLPALQKQQEKPKPIISSDKISAILLEADTTGTWNTRLGLRMGLYLGLRGIEMARAKVSCINFKNRVWVNAHTKGKESDLLPMKEQLIAFLRLYLEHHNLEPGRDDNKYLLTYKGQMVSRSFIRLPLYRISEKVLGYRISSHALRRSFICALNEAGVNLPTIQRCARHRQISTTMAYVQISHAQKVAGIESLPF